MKDNIFEMPVSAEASNDSDEEKIEEIQYQEGTIEEQEKLDDLNVQIISSALELEDTVKGVVVRMEESNVGEEEQKFIYQTIADKINEFGGEIARDYEHLKLLATISTYEKQQNSGKSLLIIVSSLQRIINGLPEEFIENNLSQVFAIPHEIGEACPAIDMNVDNNTKITIFEKNLNSLKELNQKMKEVEKQTKEAVERISLIESEKKLEGEISNLRRIITEINISKNFSLENRLKVKLSSMSESVKRRYDQFISIWDDDDKEIHVENQSRYFELMDELISICDNVDTKYSELNNYDTEAVDKKSSNVTKKREVEQLFVWLEVLNQDLQESLELNK